MEIALKSPVAIWTEVLRNFRLQVVEIMKQKMKIDLDIYYTDSDYNSGDGDYKTFIPLEICSFETLNMLLCTDNKVYGKYRSADINIVHNSCENSDTENSTHIEFCWVIDGEEKTYLEFGKNDYHKFSYSILQDEKLYDVIADWLNGEELNVSFFLNHNCLYKK